MRVKLGSSGSRHQDEWRAIMGKLKGAYEHLDTAMVSIRSATEPGKGLTPSDAKDAVEKMEDTFREMRKVFGAMKRETSAGITAYKKAAK